MNWNKLESIDQLSSVIKESHENPVTIFKHSVRCSISSMVLGRFERSHESNSSDDINQTFYFLDLIRNRDVSNAIESELGVTHQSPQVVIVHKGEAIFDASHIGINYDEVKEKLKGISSVNKE
ncbi:MAG: bacillithiol system redox-active protein YtxJ [Bacteroidota bacterium]